MKKILHYNTPLLESTPMRSYQKKKNSRFYLKMEALQPTHSFKIRGIGHLCQKATQEGFNHFISSSGGNAGLATAYSARVLGKKSTIFVPTTTTKSVVTRLRMEDAQVIIKGDVWDETHLHAINYADQITGKLVHPFDDPDLFIGHSSMIQEVHESGASFDLVVCSVGGGGLLCGIIEGLVNLGLTNIPVVAVETKGSASFAKSYDLKKLTPINQIDTIATSLGAKQISKTAFEWIDKHPIISHLVSDKLALQACQKFSYDHKVLVEPACGAALSLAYDPNSLLKDYKNILFIVCGGVGASIEKYSDWQKKTFHS
ncbi:pyridoxal-phosphate dependent enzyme [bacterium]|nr:pyridoxal-phosphate dependent enzyme [bacterium]